MGRSHALTNHDSDDAATSPQSLQKSFSTTLWHLLCSDLIYSSRMGVHMNALDLLTEDHQKVRQLFERAQQIRDNDEKKELFDQIDTELALHAEIEETIFYPAL